MMTFSLFTGTFTQSNSLNIIGTSSVDLSPVLSKLPNNTNRLVQAKNIRDAVLTLASSIAFKQTVSSKEYIGVDTLNPSNRDVKNKIYLGKRTFSTASTWSDKYSIMTYSLISNSTVDTFLFNTKLDTVDNSKTKVTFLAGTNSSIWSLSPYMQSEIVKIGKTQSPSFDFINMSSVSNSDTNINILSNSGTVSLNRITFPTQAESAGSVVGLTGASDGKVLLWNNGKLIWNDIVWKSQNFIGVTGSQLDIYGTPTNVNGYSLEFTDSRPVAYSVGDIQLGNSFSQISIQEVLKRIVYNYLPPDCSLKLNAPYESGIIEVGSSPKVYLDWQIQKRTKNTITTKLRNMVPSSYPGISFSNYKTVDGTSRGIVISPALPITTTFSVIVSDGTESKTVSKTVKACYPYFYGYSDIDEMTSTELANLTKLVEPKSNKTVELVGSGNLFFIYDSSYGLLSSVLNQNNTNVLSNFVRTTVKFSSPDGNWSAKFFNVYQWTGALEIVPPSVFYQFKY